MSDALIVFAKCPEPGRVKTRLTPVLTPGEAARLYAAFLQDALARYRRLDGVDVRLYLGAPPSEDCAALLPAGLEWHEQEGDGLGPRMRSAFQETRTAGYDRAVLIGTDHPTLPMAFVRQAFEALRAPRSICIGPSADGGFYLLGMHGAYPVCFEDMTYSHPRVFEDTLARIGQTNAQLTVLPRWYDVDTPDDLARLVGALEDEDASAPLPNTRQVVEALELGALVEAKSEASESKA
jgi:hypothetical protein